jgi:hypothetical protein
VSTPLTPLTPLKRSADGDSLSHRKKSNTNTDDDDNDNNTNNNNGTGDINNIINNNNNHVDHADHTDHADLENHDVVPTADSARHVCFVHAHRGSPQSQLLDSLSVHSSFAGKALPDIGNAPAQLWVFILSQALALELREVRNFFWLVKQCVYNVETLPHFAIYDDHLTSRELRLLDCSAMRFAQTCHAARLLVASDFCQNELAQVVDAFVAEVELIPGSMLLPSNLLRFNLMPFPNLSLQDALLLNERRFQFVRFAVNCVMAHAWSSRVTDAHWAALLLEDKSDAHAHAAAADDVQMLCRAAQWFRFFVSRRAQRPVMWLAAPFCGQQALLSSDQVLDVPIHRSVVRNAIWPANATAVAHRFNTQLHHHRARVRQQQELDQLILETLARDTPRVDENENDGNDEDEDEDEDEEETEATEVEVELGD